ncbi:MAG: hypothetical protein K2K15_00100 [Anaeroplasmataceae bacterium]|nr:hypothetical protein [Anaeroplasmataceae bacterium]
MKKFFLLLVFISCFLTSCKKQYEIHYEEGTLISVFAIQEKSNRIEELWIEYEILDEVDLFNLYTIHQNYLPIGYSSPVGPNVSLISSSVSNKKVSYYVDNFILLTEDLTAFQQLLQKTGKAFGYEEIHIFFNDKCLI